MGRKRAFWSLTRNKAFLEQQNHSVILTCLWYLIAVHFHDKWPSFVFIIISAFCYRLSSEPYSDSWCIVRIIIFQICMKECMWMTSQTSKPEVSWSKYFIVVISRSFLLPEKWKPIKVGVKLLHLWNVHSKIAMNSKKPESTSIRLNLWKNCDSPECNGAHQLNIGHREQREHWRACRLQVKVSWYSSGRSDSMTLWLFRRVRCNRRPLQAKGQEWSTLESRQEPILGLRHGLFWDLHMGLFWNVGMGLLWDLGMGLCWDLDMGRHAHIDI